MRIGNFSVLIPQGKERGKGHVCLAHDTRYTIKLSNHWTNRRCDAEVMVDGKSVGIFRINAHDTLILERPSHDSGCFTFYRVGTDAAELAGAADISASERGMVQVIFRPEYPQSPPVREKTIRPLGTHEPPVIPPYNPWMPWTPPYPKQTPPYGPNTPIYLGADAATLTGGGLSCGHNSNAGDATFSNCTFGHTAPPTQHTNCSRGMSSGPCGQSLHTAKLGLRGMKAGITGLSGESNQRFHEVANLVYDTDNEVTISLRLVEGKASGPRPLTPTPKKANDIPDPVE